MEEGNPGQRSGRHGSLADPLLRRRGRDHCFQDSLEGGAATLITLAYVFELIDWGVAAATQLAVQRDSQLCGTEPKIRLHRNVIYSKGWIYQISAKIY